MAGLSSILNTAKDALSVQSFGLNVTGQNITNATTPGYVRREAIIENRALGTQTTGSVVALGIRRAADTYADRAYYAANSDSSAASQYDSELQSVESLFNDLAETGLGDSLDAVFQSFEQLSARPNDKTVRTELLNKLDVFAGRVREVGDAIATQKTEMIDRARSTTSVINERSAEIADLNRQIVLAKQAGSDASDLIDRRNTKLLSLSDLIDVQTIDADDGSVMVRSSGTALIEGSQFRKLSIDVDDDGKLAIQATRAGGGEPSTDITRQLSGGKLAGIKDARDGDLFELSDRLDEFVFDVATAINTQHAAGVGLDGSTGRVLFDVSPTSDGAARSIYVSSDVIDNPDAIAAADTTNNLPGGSSNAVRLAALASSAISGSQTPSQTYANIVGAIGTARATATANVELRKNIFSQAETFRESTSGVNLDEEMVNLTKYQRAYEAASKVITTVDELLQRLIDTVGS
jgi:flagellar hook-associated protein 1 FlgK